jgi:cellulose synthase (UDP-forming)
VLVRNFIPLAGLAALWGLVYPGLLKSRWRLDVLRVQAIYSFTHAVAIYDVFFGKPSEWVPSNSKAGGSPTPLTTRVRKLMVGYIGVTQLAIFAGLAVHLVQYDKYTLSNWWAAVAFSIINGYVFLPVAWMSMRTFIAGRVTTRRHTAPVDLSEKSMV